MRNQSNGLRHVCSFVYLGRPVRSFLKPKVTLRAGASIASQGVLMFLTVHDRTITGKLNMYNSNGGRIQTYQKEMQQSIHSIRHFSPDLRIAVMIDFEKEEHPDVYDWLMETVDYVIKQTIPSARGATWGGWMCYDGSCVGCTHV